MPFDFPQPRVYFQYHEEIDSFNVLFSLQVPEHIRYLVIVTTNQATEGNDKDARTLLIGMDYFEGNIRLFIHFICIFHSCPRFQYWRSSASAVVQRSEIDG